MEIPIQKRKRNDKTLQTNRLTEKVNNLSGYLLFMFLFLIRHYS